MNLRLVFRHHNPGGVADGRIFNIGNPNNEISVKDLAYMLREFFVNHPDHQNDPEYSPIIEVPPEDYYGPGYQDILTRKPAIDQARTLLDWEPQTDMSTSLQYTLDAFLEEIRLRNSQDKGSEGI